MSECKHEFEHEYSDNGPLSVMLYNGTFCSKCNKEIGEYVDELRQQLAAEQAKGAEWKLKFENMEQCMLNMTVWKNQEKDRVNHAEATIAAMRSALEATKEIPKLI
jgi:hypothetical protein